MTKKVFLILLALVLALSIGIVGCTAPAEEEEEEEPEIITLSYGSIIPETHYGAEALLSWQDKITDDTDGVVQWENYFGGTLTSPTDAYSEIQAGLVDIGFIVANYEASGFEIAKQWGGFFIGAKTMEVQLEVVKSIVQTFPEIEAEFSKVKLMSCGTPTANYQLLTKEPVDSLADLAGMQLKCLPQHISALAELGATGQVMSMFDVYSSLETGIIDGVIAPTETLKSLNLVDLINYQTTIDLAIGCSFTDGMNLDTWDSLPSDIQQVFEDNKEFLSDENMRLAEDETEASIALAALQGVQFLELPPEELEELYDLLRVSSIESATQLDDLGLPGTEIYEEIQRLIAEYQS